jgi:predicted NAD/FAD-binding protein
MLEFPAESLMRFWNNHGLLSLEDRPRWQTVVGGSQSYVRAMLKELGPRVTTNAQIEHVRREESSAVVWMKSGEEHRFDRVVIATHADQALGLLADASGDEKRLLGSWTYSKNHTVLHSDESFMPSNRRAWASWNYVEVKGAMADRAVPVTYWMNLLQGLKTKRQYFVTLNPTREFRSGSVVREINYEHPQFTSAAVASQEDLPKLSGVRNTFFCGSYFGYGFHEDAVRSGAVVAKSLGVEL